VQLTRRHQRRAESSEDSSDAVEVNDSEYQGSTPKKRSCRESYAPCYNFDSGVDDTTPEHDDAAWVPDSSPFSQSRRHESDMTISQSSTEQSSCQPEERKRKTTSEVDDHIARRNQALRFKSARGSTSKMSKLSAHERETAQELVSVHIRMQDWQAGIVGAAKPESSKKAGKAAIRDQALGVNRGPVSPMPAKEQECTTYAPSPPTSPKNKDKKTQLEIRVDGKHGWRPLTFQDGFNSTQLIENVLATWKMRTEMVAKIQVTYGWLPETDLSRTTWLEGFEIAEMGAVLLEDIRQAPCRNGIAEDSCVVYVRIFPKA